jgi:hypothetical protein
LIRYILKGYKFSTLEDYYNHRNKVRKESLGNRMKGVLPKGYDFVYQLPKEMLAEYKRKILSDSKIANWMGMKVKDCPKEMIEARRLNYQINRLANEIEK